MDEADAELIAVLAEGQRIGAIGTTPLPSAIAHARRYEAVLPADCHRLLDLGSGGGLPGLVIAWDHPELEVTLVDRRSKRTDHLRRAVARLELTGRVRVVTADAKVLRRDPGYAERYDVVTARSFGPPGVTLRLALPFLRVGGIAVISEPPLGVDADLATYGLGVELVGRSGDEGGVAVFQRS